MNPTQLVTKWLAADERHANVARDYARAGELHFLFNYILDVLRGAEPGSAPWQVAQELSPNDRLRIDWQEVADALNARS